MVRLMSVSETLILDRACAAESFGKIDGVRPGVPVGVILWEEHFRAVHAGCFAHTIQRLMQDMVWVLWVVCHKIRLSQERKRWVH